LEARRKKKIKKGKRRFLSFAGKKEGEPAVLLGKRNAKAILRRGLRQKRGKKKQTISQVSTQKKRGERAFMIDSPGLI